MVSLDTSSFSAWKFYTGGIRGFYIFIQDFQYLVPGWSSSPACPSLTRTPSAPVRLCSSGAARSLRHRWTGYVCPATAAAGVVDPMLARCMCYKARSWLWAALQRYGREVAIGSQLELGCPGENQEQCCSEGCSLPVGK